MGSGIAHVAARAGQLVVLFDAQPEALDRARKGIAKDLAFLVSKQRLDATEADAILGRITMASDLEATARSALVIEAIAEDRAAKRSLFAALEAIVADDCILATNTSSISITDIAAGLRLPAQRADAIAAGAAAAMEHLHAKGLTHGDLYGHNLLVDGQGGAMLSDFGAASFMPGEASGLTQALQVLDWRALQILREEITLRVDLPPSTPTAA
jgi:hypothetical protein